MGASELKRLVLSGNRTDLSFWTNESEGCLCVEELDIRGFSGPFTFGRFTHLKRLSIHYCSHEIELPETLVRDLEKLEISDAKVKMVRPESNEGSSRLKELIIG